MGMDYGDVDYDSIHDECVRMDEAVSYTLQNHWDEVKDALGEENSQKWLLQSKPCLDLLSIVSQRDRAHMRGAIKKWLRKKQSDGDDLSEEKLFSIAADVSAFLEQLPPTIASFPAFNNIAPNGYHQMQEPTAARCIALSARACILGDELTWARDLLIVSRAFRDFLSAISDSDLHEPFLSLRIKEPIQVFNEYLRKTPAQILVYWRDGEKELRFGRSPDPEVADLSSYASEWICDYLKNHYSRLGLGVCSECGKFFARERRDKTFCSKTCQNRIAYQRKKIFESDALAQVNIAPDDACDIAPGLWMHHPRFGIGLIESVSSASKPALSLPGKMRRNIDEVRYRSMLSRKAIVQVRFLHGVRTMGYSDLFESQKTEDQLPTFYQVKSEETLAELL
jgi:hypothetical protein